MKEEEYINRKFSNSDFHAEGEYQGNRRGKIFGYLYIENRDIEATFYDIQGSTKNKVGRGEIVPVNGIPLIRLLKQDPYRQDLPQVEQVLEPREGRKIGDLSPEGEFKGYWRWREPEDDGVIDIGEVYSPSNGLMLDRERYPEIMGEVELEIRPINSLQINPPSPPSLTYTI